MAHTETTENTEKKTFFVLRKGKTKMTYSAISADSSERSGREIKKRQKKMSHTETTELTEKEN
jgi:hypothetical protein